MGWSEEELAGQLALKLIPGIGDVLIRTLVSYCGSAEAVFRERKNRLIKIPGIGEVLAGNIAGFRNGRKVEREIEFIRKENISALFFTDPRYPPRLRDLPDAPVMLFSKGPHNLKSPAIIGVVGTRNASEYGKAFTQELIESFAGKNILVVSGLAAGIDGIAHKSCLKSGIPTTGVLAHGFDRIYPAIHRQLASKMLETGGLLTEYLSGTNPDKENFPKRNRIVAGLVDVLVVVETGMKGGARITAEIACSYNREVMCLPGRVNDMFSQGCNHLIQTNKAAMITKPGDLFEYMNWDAGNKKQVAAQHTLFESLTGREKRIISYLREKNKSDPDQMSVDLRIEPGDLALNLLELECNGMVRTLPGKIFEIA